MKFDFAPELPPGTDSPLGFAGQWSIAQVRNREMVAVVEHYADCGIAWCIPQTVVTSRRTSRRKPTTHRPLFDGYIPCCLGPQGNPSKLYAPHGAVAKIIRIADQAGFVKQLDNVFNANRIAPLDPWPFAAVGRECKVRWGPFEGCQGTVIERKEGGSIVVLKLGELGGAALPISFSPDELEPVD